MIAAEHVTKEYPFVRAVHDVTLRVERGEIVLIIGPNGSGKTTLLSMLAGLLRPTRGAVRFEGKELARMTDRELAAFRLRSIGFVYQTFRLLDALSARENVQLVLELAGHDDARRMADELLERVGARDIADRSPRVLSGGEKQRVAIARALANGPAAIFADEPTGSLDSAAGAAAIGLLRDAARRDGRTVVIVSHDARIAPHADRILDMADGALA
ncbi:MAG TPA: ABC transporter ATP-binding protein [Thermoanaerobaculia bacterium]|jgi:putative ABC transport system ATP-binding protein|nr:ABC transporter ATP-binding protein [Thermoanaerobaculia bacterium]